MSLMDDLDLRDPLGHYDPPEDDDHDDVGDGWPLIDSYDETREVVER